MQKIEPFPFQCHVSVFWTVKDEIMFSPKCLSIKKQDLKSDTEKSLLKSQEIQKTQIVTFITILKGRNVTISQLQLHTDTHSEDLILPYLDIPERFH